jgi:thymidylate kinase
MQEQPHRLADASSTLTGPLSATALSDSALGCEETVGANGCAERAGEKGQSTADFLRQLFRLLNELGVRYCVIHSWEGLPEHLGSDLDLAVHPDDKALITSIIEELKCCNYVAYQWNNYITNGHSFYFYWVTGWTVNTVAVDMIFEDRRSGMILASGEEFIAGRVRHGNFWIAAPELEFSYLLVKKANKGKVSSSQTLRLKRLVEDLGREKAEEIAGKVFRKELTTRIVGACTDGSIDELFKDLKGKAWQIPVSQRPLRTIRYWMGQCRRAIWRTSHPSGILVAVLGPDGVGKSTVLEGLAQEFVVPLRRRRLFHWRPQVLARRKDNRPVTDPHGQMPRGSLVSMAYLSVFFADCWAGYLFVVRPRLVRSGFVQFDRYFHDVLVDPRRYRYGGPKWFAAFLCRLVPEPDLVILLDADEDLIRARKTELPRSEIQRQRQSYRQLRFVRAREFYVRTDAGIEPTLLASTTATAEFMAQRFNERIGHWMRVA